MIKKFSAITDSVNLHSIQTNKFKTGILSFSINMPMRKLYTPYTLLLVKLFEKATKSYPTRIALSRRVDDLYVAATDIRRVLVGKNMILSASAEMLDKKYCKNGATVIKDVCELLKEYLLSPLLDEDGYFPEDSFELTKKYSLNILKSTINNPGRYASIRISELLKRDDPDEMSLEETIEEVEKCDRFTLTQFYKENILGRTINVYYIGSLSHEALAEKLRTVLGDYCATEKNSPAIMDENSEPREIVRKDETMPILQGRLALGFRSGICLGDADCYAAMLFDELFGASASSKLFLNVREKLSLCYSCGSNYSTSTGTVTASAGISPENRSITEEAILKELENIKAGKITNKEFSAAKNSLLNSIREMNDSPGDILEQYICMHVLGLEFSLKEDLRRVSLLKKEDVVRVANKVKLDCVYFLCGNNEAVKGE